MRSVLKTILGGLFLSSIGVGLLLEAMLVYSIKYGW